MADQDMLEQSPENGVVDHVAEARLRARNMLSGEAHVGDVDDWRQSLVSARDALVLLWITWAMLYGFGQPDFTADMLIILAIVSALMYGISTGRSTHAKIQYYTAELERERTEIRENFDHECEEIQALYAAKGFQEPLLSQIVETLSADEDRLLKVMMEEELGLQMYHMNHPLLVGCWNAGSALLAGIVLALPIQWLAIESVRLWMPIAGAVLLMILSIISAFTTQRKAIEFFAVGLITAVVTGGVALYLARWLAVPA